MELTRVKDLCLSMAFWVSGEDINSPANPSYARL